MIGFVHVLFGACPSHAISPLPTLLLHLISGRVGHGLWHSSGHCRRLPQMNLSIVACQPRRQDLRRKRKERSTDLSNPQKTMFCLTREDPRHWALIPVTSNFSKKLPNSGNGTKSPPPPKRRSRALRICWLSPSHARGIDSWKRERMGYGTKLMEKERGRRQTRP